MQMEWEQETQDLFSYLDYIEIITNAIYVLPLASNRTFLSKFL